MKIKHSRTFGRHFLLSPFLMVFLFIQYESYAQATSAIWRLTADTAAIVTGRITAPVQLLSHTAIATDTLSVRDYKGSTGYPGGPIPAGIAERIWLNGTNWPTEFDMNTGRYIQFSVSPITGNSFTVRSVSFNIGCFGTQFLFANVYWSRYADFTSSVMLHSVSLPDIRSENILTLTYSFNVLVNSGETFYLRIYPWYRSTPSASKYICLTNVVISDSSIVVPNEPAGRTHIGNNMALKVYDQGGFSHPLMSSGSIIIGTDAAHVLDNIYWNKAKCKSDFTNCSNGVVSDSQESGAAEVFSTSYTDSTAYNKLGLQVNQKTYAYTGGLNSQNIIVRFDIKNRSAVPITNAYIGIFSDWDISNFSWHDQVAYDSTRRLEYQWWAGVGGVYCGVCQLSSSKSTFFRALDFDSYKGYFTENDKYALLIGQLGQSPGNTTADWMMAISTGPYDINQGGSITVGFAFICSSSNIINCADAAIATWKGLSGVGVGEETRSVPGKYTLSQNFPNPFNPSTTITFSLPSKSSVSLKIFDLLGKEVATLIHGELSAGKHIVQWEAENQSGGVYFYRLQAGSFLETKKLILLR